jgi:ribosomal protein L11 methyltransferase
MDTAELVIVVTPRDPWSDILISELSQFDFDSFVDTEDGVIAYGPKDKLDIEAIKSITHLGNSPSDVEISYHLNVIPYQNWNEKWETDFQPVFVEDKVSILAPFHSNVDVVGEVVYIQPQMSFGTGHHQTTWMLSKAIFDLDFENKICLDMGSGTGVLAIIAEKRGASSVLAIDIEENSVANAEENCVRNKCEKIKNLYGDIDNIVGLEFDIILANINKNVLKSHMKQYVTSLLPNGYLLLSGFFESDEKELKEVAISEGLKFVKAYNKESWSALVFKK